MPERAADLTDERRVAALLGGSTYKTRYELAARRPRPVAGAPPRQRAPLNITSQVRRSAELYAGWSAS
jgi:hypothetical protein